MKIELKQLLESVGRSATPFQERFDGRPYADTTGFHIYGELNLTLQLTAAEDTKDAQRLLRIIQEYALLAEACALESAAELLEVQGERIHLLLPAERVDEEAIRRLMRFSIAFTKVVYDQIGRSAGDDFNGFRMAADHGRAIILSSGNQANCSMISLGPAANAPAKEMKRNGAAAHLRIRRKYCSVFFSGTSETEWVNVPVKDPSQDALDTAQVELSQRFMNRARQAIQESIGQDPIVRFANRAYLEAMSGDSIEQPVKVQGFVLRADLDGFSKQVQIAFSAPNPDQAIAALVKKFSQILLFPAQFNARMRKTIDLPWAGDCATIVVIPFDESYEESREYLPVKAAGEWHTQAGGADLGKKQWSDSMAGARWAIGIAGGDDDEGSNGYVLVAPIAGKNRDFLVAAGWAVGRSLDAQESDGVNGEDTVLHDVDYQVLGAGYQRGFKPLDSVFWISHTVNSKDNRRERIKELGEEKEIYVPNISVPVPAPKPWAF